MGNIDQILNLFFGISLNNNATSGTRRKIKKPASARLPEPITTVTRYKNVLKNNFNLVSQENIINIKTGLIIKDKSAANLDTNSSGINKNEKSSRKVNTNPQNILISIMARE